MTSLKMQLTEEMKAQMMKLTGITDVSEFDSLVKQHVPEVGDFDQSLKKHSPFDLQMILFKELIETKGMDKYEKLSSLEDKVTFIYETLMADSDFKNIQNVCLKVKSKKDAEKSKKLRDLGNKNFQNRINYEAIRYYNESIMAAPVTDGKGQDLALGIANRSVVLLRLNEYEKCLSDISAALHFGYPDNLQYKLYERQGTCLQALGNYHEAKASFEKALEVLKFGKVTESKKQEIQTDLQKSISEVSVECENMPIALLSKDRYKVKNPHKQFPQMTDKVKIVYGEEVGRHGLATADIAPGEVILVEDPLSWTVNTAMFDLVCQGCLSQVGDTPIPSPDHETAVFCCHECLTAFTERFPINDFAFVELFSAGVAESSASAMLAYRCLVQKPHSFYAQNKETLFSGYNPQYCVDQPESWRFEGDDNIYKGVYNLVNHLDKMSGEKELNTMIKTAVLLRFLISNNYFEDEKTVAKKLTGDQAFIGKLLYTFQAGMNHNQHGVYAADGKIEAGKKLPLTDVGASFYPNLIYFNHSCAPNTLRINKGHRTYLVAKHAIRAGEEVYDCYGQHHLSSSRQERKKIISTAFMFDCKCPACRDNWPMWAGIEQRLTPAETAKLGTSLSKYQSNFRELKFEDALSHCVEYLDKLAEMRVLVPHKNYEIASMALTSCYWATLQ